MTISNRAIVKFNSDTGSTVRLSIPRANTDILDANAYDAMRTIILSGIVTTGDGMPYDVLSAEIISTKRQSLI